MDQICYDCNAKHWNGEKPATSTSTNTFYISCCKKGEVDIELLREPPAFLKDLYDNQQASGKEFRRNIRKYNSAFAFTSIRCDRPNASESNMPFQIQGQMCHVQGPLTTDNGAEARYSQLYLYDPQSAATERCNNNDQELNDVTIRNITIELHEVNPLVRLYRSAYEVLSAAASTGQDNALHEKSSLSSAHILLICFSSQDISILE